MTDEQQTRLAEQIAALHDTVAELADTWDNGGGPDHEPTRDQLEQLTPAGRVTLEVTESVLMTDPARAMKVLAELRGLGVQLALDDFGTGWSSLTHLRRMPVHEIKIDRSPWPRRPTRRDRLLHRRPRQRPGPARGRRGDRGRGGLASIARRGVRPRPGLPPLSTPSRRRI